MQEQSSFGALLKHYRLAAGLSQEALAARASLSARTISDLERGVHAVPVASRGERRGFPNGPTAYLAAGLSAPDGCLCRHTSTFSHA